MTKKQGYCNALYVNEEFKLTKGSFLVEDGRFESFGDFLGGKDMQGAYIFPGLVDIHLHGAMGYDFSSCDKQGLYEIATYQAKQGVTSFSIASLTAEREVLRKAYRMAAAFKRESHKACATLRGITMEGPFLSLEKKGAHDAAYIKLPDLAMVEQLYQDSEKLLKIVCVAPELAGAIAFICSLSTKVRLSAAHTNASYRQAMDGFLAGISHVTHLFNCTTPFTHREPGVLGAAAECKEATVEIICDGQHLHESAVRLAFTIFSEKQICLVSDSVSSCGMKNGVYQLGFQEIHLQNGRATLADGTLAGSVTPLLGCVKKAVEFGVPLEKAIYSASFNPARVLGCEEKIGSLAIGKSADFIVCDQQLNLLEVYISGERIL